MSQNIPEGQYDVRDETKDEDALADVKTRMSSSQTTVGLPLVKETQAQAGEPIYQGNCTLCTEMSHVVQTMQIRMDIKEEDLVLFKKIIDDQKEKIDRLENENKMLREKEGVCQRCLNELVSEKDCQQNDLMASFEASYQNREVTD